MNILYISKLEGKPWIGPTYSVPKQITAQRNYDNVLWYNLIRNGIAEGIENIQRWRKLDYYIDLASHPDGKISTLPKPYNHPDLIVVEQGYPYARDAIRQEIMKSGIPYIVIPRGELTDSAQKKKRIKKTIGNIILGYHRFMKGALAIQFLTQQEKKETASSWNKQRIVIPNGTVIPKNIQRIKNGEGIQCVFIGRMEPYQKGLDLLIEAVSLIKDKRCIKSFRIDLYGSDFEHKLDELKHRVIEEGLDEIITFHEATYGEEKSQILQSSDVFLIPSRFEGHPTGLLEALAYGLPCLATTGCNMRDEINNADAGWTADNSAESIKGALLAMIDSKERFEEKGRNARKLAEKYDWNAIANKTHDEYLKLLNE